MSNNRILNVTISTPPKTDKNFNTEWSQRSVIKKFISLNFGLQPFPNILTIISQANFTRAILVKNKLKSYHLRSPDSLIDRNTRKINFQGLYHTVTGNMFFIENRQLYCGKVVAP